MYPIIWKARETSHIHSLLFKAPYVISVGIKIISVLNWVAYSGLY